MHAQLLCIHNDEVQVEILMPVATLETWVPIFRANFSRLQIAEQTALRAGLEKFFTAAEQRIYHTWREG